MTPLEILDAAIAAGDLEAIAEARRLMTAKPAKAAKKTNALTDEEPVDDDGDEGDIPEDTGATDSRVECVKRPISTKPRKNKFKDRGEPFNYTPQDKKVLEQVAQQKREDRHELRPAHKKVKATCRDCKKTYLIDPSIHIVNSSVEGVKIAFLCSACLNAKGG